MEANGVRIEHRCPRCNGEEKQNKQGKNRCGTQRYKCTICGKKYTPNPKERGYSEEERQRALRTYYSGVSGRGVGKLLGMSKANVLNWIKKTGQGVDKR